MTVLSDRIMRLPRIWLFGAAICCLALLAFPALGQSDDSESEEDGAGEMSEAAQAQMALAESIVALEFNTYDTNWARYRNYRHGMFPLLDVEGINEFPFQALSLTASVKLHDLTRAEFVARLITEIDMDYDEERIHGTCDTARLAGYGDVLCVPGTSVMEAGHVVTVIYHPESLAIVAMTTSVDNTDSIATRADEWRDKFPAQAAAAQEPAAAAPAAMADNGCGPWAGGQWITVAEYQASGVTLPIVEGVVIGQPTDYQCMISPDGMVYLEAYTVLKTGGGSGSGSGGSGSGTGDDDDSDDSGGIDPRCPFGGTWKPGWPDPDAGYCG